MKTRLLLALFIPILMMLAAYLPNAVMSPNTSIEVVARAIVNCDASSTITQQGGSWVSSIGNISTGVCAITLVSGVFSDAPICVANMNQNIAGTNTRTITSTASSATSVNIDCSTGAADCTAYDVNLICMGPK